MKKSRTSPFLGAFKLRWCDHCNIPILDKKQCDLCKNETRRVKVAPPGDIRPAFEEDIVRIKKIIDDKFGTGSSFEIGLTTDRIVLLNEISYDDLMDEIILDGDIIGAIRYNLQLEDWDFSPRLKTAEKIFSRNRAEWKKFVIVDDGAISFIAEGYNVLAPGVTKIDNNLRKGESAVALSEQGKVLSAGNMRINASELANMKKGVVLKPKYSRKKYSVDNRIRNQTTQNWDLVVKANNKILNHYERKALNAIKGVMKKYPELPLSVSFSGGKDSLVCLILASKLENVDFNILFVNTGLEFPETIEYIDSIITKLEFTDKYCKMDIDKEKFWDNAKKYGPPGKDYRYCCKILKIGPVNELIEKCVGKRTLSLVGQRAYESIARAESKSLWSNPWIPIQLNFTPIQNWTALHVWLYIFREKMPYNPLYKKGFARIGCWLCPACSQGTFEIVKEVKPDFWKEWNNFLEEWRNKNDYPEEWISWGLWRWKKLPKKMFDLAEEMNVDLSFATKEKTEVGDWDLKYTPFEGFATCKTGELIVEGTFNNPINLVRLQQFWEIFTETNFDENLSILQGETNDGYSATISADGAFTASGKDPKILEHLLKKLILEVFRSEECNGCKVCLTHCPTKAIYLNEENQVDIEQEICTQCAECHNHCPVIKFGHKETEVISKEKE